MYDQHVDVGACVYLVIFFYFVYWAFCYQSHFISIQYVHLCVCVYVYISAIVLAWDVIVIMCLLRVFHFNLVHQFVNSKSTIPY